MKQFPASGLFVIAPILYIASELVVTRFSKTTTKTITNGSGSTSSFFSASYNHNAYRSSWIQSHYFENSSTK